MILLFYPLHPAYCSAIGFFISLGCSTMIDEVDRRKKQHYDNDKD